MKFENFKIIKIQDSPYFEEVSEADRDALYCEIKYRRHVSSFAGMVFKITKEANSIEVRNRQEKIVQTIDKWQKIRIGMEEDYIASVKETFLKSKKDYGIEVLFLVYCDVRSSQWIFENLMEEFRKNIESLEI